jgi:flagellar basal-body rod protein FlgB
MNISLFNKTSIPAVRKSLDASMVRSRVIANNIANINTPGYRRVDVKFEEELRLSLDRTRVKGTRTDEQHIAIGRKNLSDVNPLAYRPSDPTFSSGVNNVDIDTEMAKLAENQILFQYGVRFMKERIKTINAAIQGKSIQI